MKKLDKFIKSKILKLTEREFSVEYYYKDAQRLFEIQILNAILNYVQTGEVSKQQFLAVKRYWQAKESFDFSQLYDNIRQEDYFNSRYKDFIDGFDLSNEELAILEEIRNIKLKEYRQKALSIYHD